MWEIQEHRRVKKQLSKLVPIEILKRRVIDQVIAKIFATALQCHPAVLVFPGWESPSQKQTSN